MASKTIMAADGRTVMRAGADGRTVMGDEAESCHAQPCGPCNVVAVELNFSGFTRHADDAHNTFTGSVNRTVQLPYCETVDDVCHFRCAVPDIARWTRDDGTNFCIVNYSAQVAARSVIGVGTRSAISAQGVIYKLRRCCTDGTDECGDSGAIGEIAGVFSRSDFTTYFPLCTDTVTIPDDLVNFPRNFCDIGTVTARLLTTDVTCEGCEEIDGPEEEL